MKELARTARKTPSDDLTSALVNAELEGERLTRRGARLLLRAARRRRQRDHAQRDQPRHEGALRPPRRARAAGRRTSRASRRRRSRRSCAGRRPVIHFRRTATRDTELGGQQHPRGRQGRALVQLGATATRRSSTSPTASTSTRAPNEHVGFGGPGPHFCLGAQPRAPRDPRDVPRALPAPARPRDHRRAGACCSRTSSTASSACRARSRRRGLTSSRELDATRCRAASGRHDAACSRRPRCRVPGLDDGLPLHERHGEPPRLRGPGPQHGAVRQGPIPTPSTGVA